MYCVFRTQIGLENSHTGDRDGEEGKDEKDFTTGAVILPEVLCEGIIAQRCRPMAGAGK